MGEDRCSSQRGNDEEINSAFMTAKVQGELLQLRASLAEKDKLLEKERMKYLELKQKLDDFEKYNQVQKMKDYIKVLEAEKKQFMQERDTLKSPQTQHKTIAKSRISIWDSFMSSQTLSDEDEAPPLPGIDGHRTAQDISDSHFDMISKIIDKA